MRPVSKVSTDLIVDRLSEELVGMKGRRQAKNAAESIIKEMSGLDHSFQAYRDSYHHYHIVQNEAGGGDSIFVSFSGSKVSKVSRY
jgi:hypothetical protein